MSARAVQAGVTHRDRSVYHHLGATWGRTLCRRCGIEVRCSGLDKVDLWQPLIVVANHQSLFDIPVLLAATGRIFSFIAKKELFRIPFFGQAIRSAGCVPIDRSNRLRAHQSLDEAARQVRAGGSLVIFPEGTRSRDGRLGPFKKGAFVLAQKAGVPVLPVGIVGTRDVLPKDTWLIRPAAVDVHIGDLIACDDGSEEARDRVRDQARAAIAEMTGFAQA